MGTIRRPHCPHCPHCTRGGTRRQSRTRANAATNTDHAAANHGCSSSSYSYAFKCAVVVTILGYIVITVCLGYEVLSLRSQLRETKNELTTVKQTNEMVVQGLMSQQHETEEELTTTKRTIEMLKEQKADVVRTHEQEVERVRTEGDKLLEQVRHDSKMSIEERDEHIRRVELKLQRKTEEVIDLKIELNIARNELEQCKSSAEAWSTTAKVAGGAAILLGTTLVAPYAAPYVGAALKFASFV